MITSGVMKVMIFEPIQRRMTGLIAVTLMVIMAACGGDDGESGSKTNFQAANGTLNVSSARVERQDVSSGVWNPADGSLPVANGDAVRTDTTGHALITFFTGTEIEVLPSSELVVQRFEQSADGGAVITLNQLSGETLHRVALVADTQSQYEVDTPVAHLVVRGTEFGVSVAQDGATHVEVTAGTVRVTVGLQQFDVVPGQAIDIDANRVPVTPYQIAPILPPAGTPTLSNTPGDAAQGGFVTATPFAFAPVPTSTAVVLAYTATFTPFPTLAPSVTPLPLPTGAPTLTSAPSLTPYPTATPYPTQEPFPTPLPTATPLPTEPPIDQQGPVIDTSSAPPPGSITGQIAFTTGRDGSPQIYVMEADGTRPARLTDRGGAMPAYSPDGQQIVFQSNRDGVPDIYTMPASGGAATRISQEGGALPAWSPAGQQIAFLSTRQRGQLIYVTDPAGQRARAITQFAVADSAPAWSPDGQQIAFSMENQGATEVFLMSSDGSGGLWQVSKFGAVSGYAAWSPDGQQIVFSSTANGTADLFITDAEGNNPQRLTDLPANEVFPAWSPDGQWIAFASDLGGNQDIYVISRDGGTLYRLTDSPADDTAPAWRPPNTGQTVPPVAAPLELAPVATEPLQVVPLEVVPLQVVPAVTPTPATKRR